MKTRRKYFQGQCADCGRHSECNASILLGEQHALCGLRGVHQALSTNDIGAMPSGLYSLPKGDCMKLHYSRESTDPEPTLCIWCGVEIGPDESQCEDCRIQAEYGDRAQDEQWLDEYERSQRGE